MRFNHLPRDSEFYRSIDPDATRWSETEHAIADLIDVTIAVHGGKQRWERPGQKAIEAARRDARAKRWEERQRTRAKQRGEAAT